MAEKNHCAGGCGDMCDSCLGGQHHGIARMLLGFAILTFVFFIGIALGEMKAYIREMRFGGSLYDYSERPGMMGGSYDVNYYRMMKTRDIPTPSPSPVKK